MMTGTYLSSYECAKVLKAMGDHTRLRILRHLVAGEKPVTVLAQELSIEQPKASHHLGILRRAGLVIEQREGRQTFYRLHPTVHKELSQEEGMIDLGCCSVDLKKEN